MRSTPPDTHSSHDSVDLHSRHTSTFPPLESCTMTVATVCCMVRRIVLCNIKRVSAHGTPSVLFYITFSHLVVIYTSVVTSPPSSGFASPAGSTAGMVCNYSRAYCICVCFRLHARHSISGLFSSGRVCYRCLSHGRGGGTCQFSCSLFLCCVGCFRCSATG